MKRLQALTTALLFLPVTAATAISMPVTAHKSILAATDPAALMQQGDTLAAAGKFDQAAESYSAAAQAYENAGQTSQAVDAYKKAAEMSEKAADAALNGGGGTVTPAPTPAPAPKARPVPAKRHVVAPALHKPVPVASVAARSGHIVGRAVTVDGAPIPSFTIMYSGFEDGKLASEYADGSLAETINTSAHGQNGRYSVKVPPGAYRVSGYVTYHYIWFDGAQTYMGVKAFAAMALGWGDVINTQFQVDGYGSSGSVTNYIDGLKISVW